MPNGGEINDELEFKEHIKDMSEREILVFVAEKAYDHDIRMGKVEQCIEDAKVEAKAVSRKSGTVSGTISSVIVSAVIGLISYFKGGN